jgi:hypothetical protein
MAARLLALRTGRTLLPRNIIIFLLLELISVGGLSEPQGLVLPEGLGELRNSPSLFLFYAYAHIGDWRFFSKLGTNVML